MLHRTEASWYCRVYLQLKSHYAESVGKLDRFHWTSAPVCANVKSEWTMPPQTCRILFQFLKILYFERRELWPGVLPSHTKWTEMQSCVKRSFTGDTRDTLRNVRPKLSHCASGLWVTVCECLCVLCGYGNAHSNPGLGATVLGCWRTKKKDLQNKRANR